MLELARIYREGREDITVDMFEAYKWAHEAARRDSPEGYMEITRILGSVCIAANEYGLQQDCVRKLVTVCDPDTLFRLGLPDIAFNVGSITEYMARLVHDGPHYLKDMLSYYETAVKYFSLAASLQIVSGNEGPAPASIPAAQEGIGRVVEELRGLSRSTSRRPLIKPSGIDLL